MPSLMSCSEGVTRGSVFTGHEAEAAHMNLVTIFEMWGSGGCITLLRSKIIFP